MFYVFLLSGLFEMGNNLLQLINLLFYFFSFADEFSNKFLPIAVAEWLHSSSPWIIHDVEWINVLARSKALWKHDVAYLL